MTEQFIIVWIMLAIMYTLWAYLNKSQMTISMQFREWSIKYPFIPWSMAYIFGVLCGHWFWPQ